jgi:hypothetical protein
MSKLTLESIERDEIESLFEYLTTQRDFWYGDYARYITNDVAEILFKLPDEEARKSVVAESMKVEDAFFNGTVWPYEKPNIYIPDGEIEVQFEGKPEDAFDEETLKEAYINDESSDLAYFSFGYGVVFPVNINKLREAAKTYGE